MKLYELCDNLVKVYLYGTLITHTIRSYYNPSIEITVYTDTFRMRTYAFSTQLPTSTVENLV